MTDTRILRSLNWRAIPLDRRTARALGEEFQVAFLESSLEQDPTNIEILVQVGDLYARLGEIRKSLAIDLRLIDLCPQEKVFHYNLACSYSLLNDLESALFALEKAFLLGYDDVEQIQGDADLANLRQDGRFQRLVREHFEHEHKT
jgi:tetratricopeptide (TPR) repeat protein